MVKPVLFLLNAKFVKDFTGAGVYENSLEVQYAKKRFLALSARGAMEGISLEGLLCGPDCRTPDPAIQCLI